MPVLRSEKKVEASLQIISDWNDFIAM